MGSVIAKVEGLKREKGYLYYVTFDDKGCNICKAQMVHKGRIKKKKK